VELVSCLCVDAPVPSLPGAWLRLDGEGEVPVDGLCSRTQVFPVDGPPGRPQRVTAEAVLTGLS
jgi:hypothetical protein